MTDEPQPKEQEVNPVEKLRNEFQEQFTTMRDSYDSLIAELRKSNDELTKHNQDLERALLRSAVSPTPAPKEPEKTEEDLYKEKINALAEKSKKYEEFI